MVDKLYIVTDLGPGDGGKGGVVHFLANKFRSYTSIIIKEGGAQGSHGVMNSAGEKFNFSQWGCGTLEGVLTYLSERFIISPIGLLNEAAELQHHQINDPFSLLSVHPNCLVATPYHQVWSQIDELLRRDHPRGTVGTGVGKAYRESISCPDLALRAQDLATMDRTQLAQRLDAQRFHVISLLKETKVEDVLPEDRELYLRNFNILSDTDSRIFFDIVDKFRQVGQKLKFYGLEETLNRNHDLAIVERSHGVLTDAEDGFKPHVSAIRTLPKFSEEMFKDAGFSGKIRHLGVHRAYEIRHGAGPLPSHDPAMGELLPGSCKATNRFQGEVRVGPLDVVLLEYALTMCSETPLDCLCITWFDQIVRNGKWDLCTGYPDVDLNRLQKTIFSAKTYERETIPLPKDLNSQNYAEKIFHFCAETLSQFVKTPVRLVSYGPSELEKIIK